MRLNKEMIRRGFTAGSNSSPPVSELIEGKNDFELTRRELLSLAATLGSISVLDSVFLGTAQFDFKPGRAAFSIFGEERWVIDTRRFSGNPRLKVEHNKDQIRINLAGARYPGTQLSADFVCRLKPTLKGWRMHLQMAGGLNAFVSLEKWLLGLVQAGGTTSSVQQIGRDKKIIKGRIKSKTRYRFMPDGSMIYAGLSASELHLSGANIVTDELTIRLPDTADESLLKHSAKRKVIIEPAIDMEKCRFEPVSGGQTDWKLSEEITDFKKLRIELAESTRGRVYGGYLAEIPEREKPLLMRPSPSLCSSSGQASSIALSGLVYATAFDGNKAQAVLSADIDQQPRWLQAGEYSVMLAGSNKLHRFELELINGSIRRVSCNAALVGSMLPPGDDRVITRPVGAYEGETLQILYGKRMPRKNTENNTLLISPGGDAPPRLQLANARVEMIRPDDLVVLGFEFINMALVDETSLRQTRVLQPTGGDQAYLVVYHQPQNIAEQAFPETDGENTGEDPLPPPVSSMYSGESRVVVKVPAGETIPYTLEDLLSAAAEYELSVTTNSLPPPYIAFSASIYSSFKESLDLAGVQHQISQEPTLTVRQGGISLGIEPEVSRRSAIAPLRGIVMQEQGQRIVRDRSALLGPSRSGDFSAIQLIRSRRDLEMARTSTLGVLLGPQEGASNGLRNPTEAPDPVPTTPSPPDVHHTALELPFRLIISPHAGEGWAHSAEPVISPQTGRVELWHSRLGMRVGGNSVNDRHPNRTIRAIWYNDNRSETQKRQYGNRPPENPNNPFLMSLNARQRHQLVHQSSNFLIPGFTPGAVAVRNLMLSSLGAWIDVRGVWNNRPTGLGIEEWLHRGTLGRDHYVKVVEAGRLFPFGHRASLITITERKIHSHPQQSNVPVAYLRQRRFIVIREPVVFKALGDNPNDRQMPFKSVEITNLSTPLLDNTGEVFWPAVGGDDFQFNLRLEDTEGHTTEITMPLAFIIDGAPEGQVDTLIDNFNEEEPIERRQRPFAGQTVALASAELPGDTDFEVETLTFHAETVSNGLGYEPVISEAEMHIPALTQMTGIELTRTHFHPAYLEHGFAASGNEGQVLLEMSEDDDDEGTGIHDLNFDGKGDRSGGFVQPNMMVTGLSRSLGPVGGDLDTAVGGEFDPQKYFGGGDEGDSNLQSEFSPKLFGVIDLWDIIEAVGLDDKEKVPTLLTEALDLVERFVKDLDTARQTADRLAGEGITGAGQARDTAGDVYSSIEGFLENPDSFNAGALQGQLDQLQDQLTGLKEQLTPQNLPVESLRREAERNIRLVLELIDTSAKITEMLALTEDFVNAVELAKQMRIRLEWKPAVKDWPTPNSPDWPHENSIFVANNDKTGRDSSFVLAVEMQAQQENVNGNGGAGFEVICCLDHFTVDLIGSETFIKLYFKKMAFFARTGQKAGVVVDFQGIEFAGPLSFIERLRALIPLDGFSDPPFVDVDEKGITAGFDFEIPTVGMGVFTLQNVVLGAKLNIPYIGDPLSITFFFNTRENPCSITVIGIGGGGYVGITVDMQGLQVIEAAVEFGGSVAFDVVVASGSVYIFAGIFFRLERQEDVTIIELAGYLRLGGKVKVLGLIGISIELRMELAYQANLGQGGKVIGRASLEVKVELLFYEAGVTISVERKFSARPDDPTFLDAMGDSYTDPVTAEPVQPWQQYCLAFAE